MLIDKLLTNLEIHVAPFAICQLDSGWRLGLPGPAGVMVHFVLSGSGRVRGPQSQTHPLGPNSFAIVPAGASHALEANGTVEHELRIEQPPGEKPVHQIAAGGSRAPIMVVACGVLFARFDKSLGLFDHLREIIAVDMSDTKEVAVAFRGILAEQSKPDLGSDVLTAALMSQCLVYLFRHLCADPRHRFPWLTALKDPRLGRAIDRILENPAENYTVESLADIAGMSRSTFAQHFALSLGCTPMAMVHAVRMQRAADLLRKGLLSIDKIGHHVGYASRSQFSKAFKKHIGVPPNEFRHADNLSPVLAAGRVGSSSVTTDPSASP